MEEKNKSEYVPVSERLKLFRPGMIKTVEHYPTGIQKLDQMLGGGLYAGLIFLGARPGMGKSTLALQIASEVAAGGTPVLFYSLEMPAIRLESKILNRAIHLEQKDSPITSDWLLRTENTGKSEEWEMAEEVGERISSRYSQLYIKERKQISFSAEDVIADVERFMEQTGKKPVVFVDYLQILSACTFGRNQADKQRTDENINALSSLSNKHDMAVFVISSLNRESYKNTQKPLQMDSFKETGGIEYSASVILGLQSRKLQNENYDHEAEMSKDMRELEIVFLKQRYGRTGQNANVPVDFYPAYDLYIDPSAKSQVETQTVYVTKERPVEGIIGASEEVPSFASLDRKNSLLFEKFQQLQKK